MSTLKSKIQNFVKHDGGCGWRVRGENSDLSWGMPRASCMWCPMAAIRRLFFAPPTDPRLSSSTMPHGSSVPPKIIIWPGLTRTDTYCNNKNIDTLVKSKKYDSMKVKLIVFIAMSRSTKVYAFTYFPL